MDCPPGLVRSTSKAVNPRKVAFCTAWWGTPPAAAVIPMSQKGWAGMVPLQMELGGKDACIVCR